MSDELVTPLEVEREMVDLNTRIGKAPAVIRDAHNRMRTARAAHKKAWALAYKGADGTQAIRKAEADLATADLADILDSAQIEYRFVIDTFDSLRTKLRALQSVASLMKASMYGPQGGI